MVIAITLSDGTIYRVEAACLKDVQNAIATETPLTRFWHDSVTGKRWEEITIFVDRPKLIAEDAQEPVN